MHSIKPRYQTFSCALLFLIAPWTRTSPKKTIMKKRFYKLLNASLVVLLVFSAGMVQAQTRTVTGTIIGSDDPSGLPGVNVQIKGTSIGAITDAQGKFMINISDDNAILIVSYIGYTSQEISVGSQTVINVTLQVDATTLEEIVVVGYGTQKKVNLTGAVDQVGGEQLANRPIVSTGGGLQGLIPGLNVTIPSGDPTQGAVFNIRGFESINGGAPLILVDNVPMDINRINPNDIKSVTVLKDGAASAIYGARAAFGVILVETKQGKQGINIQVGSQFTWDKPIWYVEPIKNGYQYASLRNEVLVRGGGGVYYQDEYMGRLQTYWDDPANNDPYAVVDGQFENYGYNGVNEQLIGGVAPRQKYDISISGASDKATYYSSFGFLNSNGYLDNPGNDNFKRYNILLKGEYAVTDWMKLSMGTTLNMQQSDRSSQADINTLIRAEPIRAWVVPDNVPGFEEYGGMYWDNPFTILADLDLGGRSTFSNSDIWLNSGITLTPIKRLTIKSNFSYNIFNQNSQSARLPFQMVSGLVGNPPITYGDNEIDVSTQYNQYYVWNNFAEYLMEDWTDHYLKVMVGFNQEWALNNRVNSGSSIFLNNEIINIGSTTGLRTITSTKSHTALRGAFYRLNYIYKDKYLFEANGRYDGTSRFPKADRFGFFPSFSAGWRISNESFMDFSKSWLDNLKIRASYGALGNQLLGNNFYPYIPSMSNGNSDIILGSGQIPFVNDPGIVSPTLTWEQVITQNIGIDMAFLGGKLQSSFDIYTRDTKDMLLRREYPAILGTGAPQENGADLRTKGWELALKWKDNITSDLKYFVDFNLADWTAEITKYENETGAISEYYEGQKLGEIWGYETVGIIQNADQLAELPDQTRLGNNWIVGDIQYADLDGDGAITQGDNTIFNSGDRKIIGNNSPRYTIGLNTGATYKAFTLNIFFQGVGKRDYVPSTNNWTWFYPWRSMHGDQSWIDNSWTPEKPDAYFPIQNNDTKNFAPQTRFIQNAAYIRLKNISIGYNLPPALVNKIGLGGVNVYVGAQNLWEYSKIRKPLDPEYIFDQSINYPLFRSYTFGINVNL